MKHLFNFFRDHIVEYLFIALALAGVGYLAFTYGSYAKPGSNPKIAYVEKIFDQSYVHKVEIEIASDDFQNLLAAPREKEKYATKVVVDGEQFNDVAFSTRGNGSLMELAADEESDRYSYTLNFRKFTKDNSYHGLDKLVLNNLYVDSSYLKNYLAFKLAAAAGVDAPLTSFTELYINGELKGLYLAIEGVDRSFLARTNSSSDAALFHPVPYSIDHNRVYQESKSYANFSDGPWANDPGYNGANLKYLGDTPESYDAILKNATTKYSRADETLIIDAIRSLEPSELSRPPEDFWDVDAVISFFTAAALTPNVDSYIGVTAQNYYLKISNGKLSLIPWDHDRAFHVGGLSQTIDNEDGAILWPIDSPLIDASSDDRPLWRFITDNPEYLAKYHSTLQTALDAYLLNGKCRQEFDAAVELIRHYVYSDPTRFSSTDEFEDEVEYLRRFILLRADSIQKQLWGLLPSTRDESEPFDYESLIPSGILPEGVLSPQTETEKSPLE